MKSYFTKIAARSVGARSGVAAGAVLMTAVHRHGGSQTSQGVADPFENPIDRPATHASVATHLSGPLGTEESASATPTSSTRMSARRTQSHRLIKRQQQDISSASSKEGFYSQGSTSDLYLSSESRTGSASSSDNGQAWALARTPKRISHTSIQNSQKRPDGARVQTERRSSGELLNSGALDSEPLKASLAQADAFMARITGERASMQRGPDTGRPDVPLSLSSVQQTEPPVIRGDRNRKDRENEVSSSNSDDGFGEGSASRRTRLTPMPVAEPSRHSRSATRQTEGPSLVIGTVTVEVASPPPTPISQPPGRTIVVRQGNRASANLPSSRRFGLNQF